MSKVKCNAVKRHNKALESLSNVQFTDIIAMEDASVDAKGRRETMNTESQLILQLTSFLSHTFCIRF